MKSDAAEERASLYHQFLRRSFRDIQTVDFSPDACSDAVGVGSPQHAEVHAAPCSSPPHPFQQHELSMYHANFELAMCRVEGASSSASGGGGGRPRIVDIKPIQCATSESCGHNSCSDLVGFAVLCARQPPQQHAAPQQNRSTGRTMTGGGGGNNGMYCVIQLFHDPQAECASSGGTTPNPDDWYNNSTSDCATVSHSPFTAAERWVVQLPDALPSTRLSYVGGGILLFLSTSPSAAGRVDYVDLLTASEKPLTVIAERVAMEPREIISAKATAVRSTSMSTDVVVSCVTRRSHFTIKFERNTSATPRAPQAGRLTVSTSVATQVHTMDHPPCHLALSPSVALIFLPIKLEKKWALLRVTDNWQECQGKNVLEGIDLKCKVTCAGQFIVPSRGDMGLIVIGSEDGLVGVLPRHTNEGSEVRTTVVFEGSDPQQRAITGIEQTSTPGVFSVYSRTSAALVHVDASGGVSLLSKKVSATVTSHALLHVHLHRDISANPNYVLLSADVNSTNVHMSTFLNTASLDGCAAMTVHASRPSPPVSNRDLHMSTTALPPALSHQRSPPQQTQPTPPAVPITPSSSSGSVGSTSTSTSGGLFGKFTAALKAKLARKSSGSSAMGADQFVPRVGQPVAVYCDGFCRKSLTSSGDQHRIVALDVRLHGFLVWLRMHDQDDLLMLSDSSLPHGLSMLHREDL